MDPGFGISSFNISLCSFWRWWWSFLQWQKKKEQKKNPVITRIEVKLEQWANFSQNAPWSIPTPKKYLKRLKKWKKKDQLQHSADISIVWYCSISEQLVDAVLWLKGLRVKKKRGGGDIVLSHVWSFWLNSNFFDLRNYFLWSGNADTETTVTSAKNTQLPKLLLSHPE